MMDFLTESHIILDAVSYQDVAKHTPVININQFSDTIHIHLPVAISNHIHLVSIDEVIPKSKKELNFADAVVREEMKPWLDVSVDWLNKDKGQHIYKLTFNDTKVNATFPLYVGYIIQEDHPEQNYVYMKRDENE